MATAPPTQPKKRNGCLIAVLVVVGLLVLGGIATVVLIGSAANEVSKSIEASDNETGGVNKPITIQPGEAFEVRGFDYAAGWTVGADDLGDFEVAGLKVTNNRDDRDGAIVEVKLMKGTEVVATADCTTEQILTGQTTSISCFSADDFTEDYDAVTINDSF